MRVFRVVLGGLALALFAVVLLLTVGPEQETKCTTELGSWRGAPAKELAATMLARARGFQVKLGRDTVEHALTHLIIDNRALSDDTLVAMSHVSLDALSDKPDEQSEILAAVPNARELPSHAFAVGLVSSVTGISASDVSNRCPGLGVFGAPGTPFLSAPRSVRTQRVTALHDFTDYFRNAGVGAVNAAAWEFESRSISALRSGLRGPPYHESP